ncbi:hypothetical protein ATJ97_0084 [Georgenia soli]|uniref:Uncharacterized protein n=2 Tax=Georgenia soli TaxID=638953 RepID=A0A2A9F2N4_9MICO|nr:hypothetical protein ATJ97_0084 [Georgenia soli]
MPGLFDDADVISTYTRTQALADGALVTLPAQLVGEAGFTCPIDMTAGAWADTVRWTDVEESAKPFGTGQDETGRAWDVLTMLRLSLASHTKRTGAHRYGDRIPVTLVRVPPSGTDTLPRPATLHAVLGADEDHTPTITLMRPDEADQPTGDPAPRAAH